MPNYNTDIHNYIEDLVIDYCSGACPFQAEGRIQGMPFYYRERSGYASLSLWREDTGKDEDFLDPDWSATIRLPQWRSQDNVWLDTFINLITELEPNELGQYHFWAFPPRTDCLTKTAWLDERLEAFALYEEEDDINRLVDEVYETNPYSGITVWAENIEQAREKANRPKDHSFMVAHGSTLEFEQLQETIMRQGMAPDPIVLVEPTPDKIGPCPIKITIPDEWVNESNSLAMGKIHTPWRASDDTIMTDWEYDEHTDRHRMVMDKARSIGKNREDLDVLETSRLWALNHPDPSGREELLDFCIKTLIDAGYNHDALDLLRKSSNFHWKHLVYTRLEIETKHSMLSNQ